jgi:hypothetical protein
MLTSQSLINECIADSSLILSTFFLQELAFTLSKLNVPSATILDSFNSFKIFVKHEIDVDLCDSAFQLAVTSNMLRNMNDSVHIRFA